MKGVSEDMDGGGFILVATIEAGFLDHLQSKQMGIEHQFGIPEPTGIGGVSEEVGKAFGSKELVAGFRIVKGEGKNDSCEKPVAVGEEIPDEVGGMKGCSIDAPGDGDIVSIVKDSVNHQRNINGTDGQIDVDEAQNPAVCDGESIAHGLSAAGVFLVKNHLGPRNGLLCQSADDLERTIFSSILDENPLDLPSGCGEKIANLNDIAFEMVCVAITGDHEGEVRLHRSQPGRREEFLFHPLFATFPNSLSVSRVLPVRVFRGMSWFFISSALSANSDVLDVRCTFFQLEFKRVRGETERKKGERKKQE